MQKVGKTARNHSERRKVFFSFKRGRLGTPETTLAGFPELSGFSLE